MGKPGLIRRLVAWAALLWFMSSAIDPATAGPGGDGRECLPAHGSGGTVPASRRMAALRALQQAPGHDFERSADASHTLSARMGVHGAGAEVEIVGQRVAIRLDAGARAFGLRTAHVGRLRSSPSDETAVPLLHETRAEGQEAVLVRVGIEERYLAGPLGLEQSYVIDARPEGVGPLAIEVAFDGLAPRLSLDAEDVVELVDEPEQREWSIAT